MINKLLITCLQRNKRLVIPTLGAFIRKNIDGVGVALVFVPFLNKDDGVLFNAIKNWAGVEDDDAKNILDEYVAAIKKSLETKSQYIIEGIGVLKYDSNDILYLAKESDATITKEDDKEKDKDVTTENKESEPVKEVPVQYSAPVAPTVEINLEPKLPIIEVKEEPIAKFQEIELPHIVPQQPPVHEEEAITPPPPIQQPVASQNRPGLDGQYQRGRDIGTRYFSPSNKPNVDESEQTSNTQQRVNPNQTESQGRMGSIYGASGMQNGRFRDPNARGASASMNKPYPNNGASRRPMPNKRTASKKKVDTIVWIAIIAVALALGVLIYGLMYGGETTLPEDVNPEQMVMPSVPENVDIVE